VLKKCATCCRALREDELDKGQCVICQSRNGLEVGEWARRLAREIGQQFDHKWADWRKQWRQVQEPTSPPVLDTECGT